MSTKNYVEVTTEAPAVCIYSQDSLSFGNLGNYNTSQGNFKVLTLPSLYVLETTIFSHQNCALTRGCDAHECQTEAGITFGSGNRERQFLNMFLRGEFSLALQTFRCSYAQFIKARLNGFQQIMRLRCRRFSGI